MAQEFSELSWWVAHAQNCGVGGEEWASHTVGVAPACQGHIALPFPVLRALLTPALRRWLLQAGPPSPPGAAFRVLLVLSLAHQVGYQGVGDSRPSPAASAHRDAPAPSAQEYLRRFPGAFSATNTTVRRSQGTDLAVSRCLPCVLRGWNLCRGGGMRRLLTPSSPDLRLLQSASAAVEDLCRRGSLPISLSLS